MDIDIQTILQQDIDLGIKKNVNYEYERVDSSSATASSVGYELFNKYIGNNGGTGASNENTGLAAGGAVGNLFLKPPQFDASESLKNQDIVNMENFFASEAIPDGYKLVVEEDTGEWFMIMMRNDSANHSGSQQQVDETSNGFQLGQNESNVDIAFADLYLQEEEAQQLQQQQQQQSARVNQLEQYETSTSPTVRTFKRVEFLSQMSVNNELGKLSLHVEEPSLDPSAAAASAVVSDAVTSNISSSSSVNNATSLISALDDSLTSIEPNLLDEDWINNFLSGGLTSPLSASGEPQQQQQQQLLQQQQITNVSAVVSSSIDNDAMLSTLNANNSIILNDAASTPSHRNQTSLFVGANGVANTTIEFELNTESLELLFNSSLLDSLVDPRSTGGAAIAVSSNMSSLVTTNGTADKLAECVDQFDVFFSNSNIPIKMNDESTTNNGVELTNAFDGKEKMVAKQETTTELFRQQSSLIDSTFIKEEAVEQEDIYGIEANNGALPQTLYVDMSSASAAPATSRVTNEAALAGLYHNHTYMGAGSSSSSSSAGNEMAFENAVADPSIELHPYSYKSKMLKRIQKTRMMNIKDENGSRANQSRDEQALRDASIELSIEDVVDSSADDFNELIRARDFTSDQVNLLKDIRRRGKNKVAAQICRKRKLDSIDSLRDKVDELKSLKSELISEYNAIHDEIKQMTFKFDSLYKDAVGANNYDQNDPIVGFINNLKVLNADPTAASAVASSSARDRKKTYSSINSSDFDSSLSSMSGPSSHMSTFSELDDYDEEDEEDEDEDADLYDEDEDDEDEGVDEDDDQVVEAVRSSRRASSSSKKAAAAAATATMAAVNKNKKMRKN